jgi:hypothetical protein
MTPHASPTSSKAGAITAQQLTLRRKDESR